MVKLRKRPPPRPMRTSVARPGITARDVLCWGALLLAAFWMTRADAAPTTTIVVMPRPDAVASTDATAGFLAHLQSLTHLDLTVSGKTRTGALVLALPAVSESNVLLPLLRMDRSVLWADLPPGVGGAKVVAAKHSTTLMGQKLMVRLNDGVEPDWDTLSARFGQILGVGVSMQRHVGNVWVLMLAAPQPEATLVEMASLLEMDRDVRYADPVLRRFTQAAAPNDPSFNEQWNLTDSVSGINVQGAWDLQKGNAPVNVAVVDTGILPHPDLAGKVLPGYDFISDAGRARDGDARDANPRDEGDWIDQGDCFGFLAPRDSSWHGTFVAGLIAATRDNGIGIAGVDRNARIVPVRALGACGGSDEDIFEAVVWASGGSIPGVPANANPAKVINLSLGGFGACDNAVQEAVDDAMAQGAIVVAAAGNSANDASSFNPANCGGVITVGAHTRDAVQTVYTNFGTRVDISAPAGDGSEDRDTTLSTSNDGKKTPGNPTYKTAVGTSFSAPLVAGTVSMMVGRNPMLTAGHVLSILQATSRSFVGVPCRSGNVCGTGMLDAGAALASTPSADTTAPAGAVTVVEYYNAALDHYFITAYPAEIAVLDASSAFVRTGFVFYGYPDQAHAPASAKPVCRFYAPSLLVNSHFFSANPAECTYVQQNWNGAWQLETPAAFYIDTPDASGNCRAGTVPVHRFFDGRSDANHRYTIDLSVVRSMINRAWVLEGNVFCSPV